MDTIETEPDTSTPRSRPRLRWLRKPWVIAGLAALLAGAVWLAFGFFGVHTLFTDEKVDEARPVFAGDEASETEPAGTEPMDGSSATTMASEPSETVVSQGTFIDRSHPSEGTAIVLSDGADQRVLRFEDFETDNGPDLFVYLSTAPPDAPEGAFDDDFVNLGDLKGNIGNQNYEIPPNVDLDHYSTVVIWCRRFSVAFGTAGLA